MLNFQPCGLALSFYNTYVHVGIYSMHQNDCDDTAKSLPETGNVIPVPMLDLRLMTFLPVRSVSMHRYPACNIPITSIAAKQNKKFNYYDYNYRN